MQHSSREFEHEMIHPPGSKLLHSVPLAMVRERARGGKRRDLNVSLNLTAFIDFLVVVVVFLLMSFSASGEVLADADVPFAHNAVDMTDTPMVSVIGTQVLLDGIATDSIRPILESQRMGRAVGLFDRLKHQKQLWTEINPTRDFPGAVTLQIDQEVPAIVVKSVLRTAVEAGYPQVSFMVGRLPKGP